MTFEHIENSQSVGISHETMDITFTSMLKQFRCLLCLSKLNFSPASSYRIIMKILFGNMNRETMMYFEYENYRYIFGTFSTRYQIDFAAKNREGCQNGHFLRCYYI